MDSHSGIVEGTTITCKRAWLVTWEWSGDHAKVEKKLVAILNYRYSADTVERAIEQFYASNWFAYHGQLAYAIDRKHSPYQVQRGGTEPAAGSAASPQAPLPGEMTCGGNPWLRARMAFDLQAYVDEDGNEHLRWREQRHVVRGGRAAVEWEECHLASTG